MWLNRLIADNGNLRAALEWCLESRGQVADTDNGDHERAVLGLRLAGALWWFWHMRTERGEGRRWLTLALEQTGIGDPFARVRALYAAGWMAHLQDDNASALTWEQNSLALAHSLSDTCGAARALLGLGLITRKQGALARAATHLAESLVLCAKCGDRWTAAYVCFIQGLVAMDQTDYRTAQHQLVEGIRLFEQCGDHAFTAWPRYNQGQIARFMGEFHAAAVYYDQSLAILRSTHSHAMVTEVSVCVGHLARMQGDDSRAWTIYREQLVMLRAFGNRRHTADCFDGIADIACRHGQVAWAAQILGAAAALREAIRVPVSLAERDSYEQIIKQVRSAMGAEVFTATYTAGHMLHWETVAEEILALPTPDSRKEPRVDEN